MNNTARLASALFFFVCLPLSLFDQFYVPKKIFVPQDAVATANNLLANEFIFRTSIVSHLVGITIFVLMIILFSRIFITYDSHLSQLMVIAAVATLPIIYVMEVLNYSALMILKGDPQQQETAYLLLRIYRYGIAPGLGKFFFGLCFIPFGMLVFRSGAAPRIIGILVIIGGVGYVTDCFISLLFQRPDYLMIRPYLMVTTVAYFIALLWFLIKGMRKPI
jgi:hypothetical protein